MSTSTLTEQNKLTTEQAIGISVGVTVIITVFIMAVIGMLSVFYCFVLKKKQSKLTDIVVDNINITSENTTVAHRNHINSTTPLYDDSTNSKISEDYYEMNNNKVPDDNG